MRGTKTAEVEMELEGKENGDVIEMRGSAELVLFQLGLLFTY